MKEKKQCDPTAPAFSIFNPDIGDWWGLTKREYFAAMALQGIYGESGALGQDHNHLAANAVKAADALIEALNK